MRVTTGFFLCFLVCASGVNAESILCKKEWTTGGNRLISFTNTNVNLDRYPIEMTFYGMTGAEKLQAEAIERENRYSKARDRETYRQRTAEIERGREIEAYKKQMEQKEIEEKKARKPKVVPVLVINK